jgi:exopolyphosphatase/guanosine-5'-triphosphate,3'-diphosphate pyrophosphatase
VRVAAVDCGTNTTRLLVAEVADDGTVAELERRAEITRIGKGVDATGVLAPAGIEHTVAVLREYGEAIRAAGVERVRAIATSASRDATNRDDFFGPGADALGAPLELISGEEEGRLAFAGATLGLDAADAPFLVLDIGGGSTELILGTTDVDHVVSMDIGSVRLTEQWLRGDPPTAEELSMAVSVVRTYVDEVVLARPDIKEAGRIVGVAGTITTIAAIELGYYDPEVVHHFDLTRKAAEDVFRTVATEPLARRVHNPGLDPKRADVIVGGCCVLVAVLRHLDAPGLLVSETDILHGIARALGR